MLLYNWKVWAAVIAVLSVIGAYTKGRVDGYDVASAKCVKTVEDIRSNHRAAVSAANEAEDKARAALDHAANTIALQTEEIRLADEADDADHEKRVVVIRKSPNSCKFTKQMIKDLQ
jgi:hypothetical protein